MFPVFSTFARKVRAGASDTVTDAPVRVKMAGAAGEPFMAIDAANSDGTTRPSFYMSISQVASGDPDRVNQIWNAGWNSNGSGKVIAGLPGVSLQLESYFNPLIEAHLQFWPTSGSTQIRAWSWIYTPDSGYLYGYTKQHQFRVYNMSDAEIITFDELYNYFAKKIGINIAPVYELDVNGAARFADKVGLNTTPGVARLDIRENSASNMSWGSTSTIYGLLAWNTARADVLASSGNALWLYGNGGVTHRIELDSAGVAIGGGGTGKVGFFGATPALQPTTIADADGTLADLTTKFNSLLSKLETLGIVAAA